METRFFGESQYNNKRRVILGFVAALALVGVVATVAVVSQGPSATLSTYQEQLGQFHSFMETHGKSYTSHEEYAYRFRVFRDNVAMIEAHNQSGQSYTMAVNQFADLTKEEFKAQYLSPMNTERPQVAEEEPAENLTLSTIDWVKEGAVTPVENQGQCLSSWAFSTTGALEGAYSLQFKELKSFSEQQLVDCSVLYGNRGCNGGLIDYAFNYVDQKGIVLESEYPYVDRQTQCNTTIEKNDAVAHTKGVTYTIVKPYASSLYYALRVKPISVFVDAENWQFYSGGVLSYCRTSLNHSVVLVGYDSVNNAWKIKNSWGPHWGDSGYIYIAYGDTCGVCTVASYPTFKEY